MFSIDLLKGKELPEKPDLRKSALKAVPILIPLLAVTVLGAMIHHDGSKLKNHRQTLQENQKTIDLHSNDMAEYNEVSGQINGLKSCLNDISKALSYRVQVSDVMLELVQAMPEGIFLYEMDMERESAKEKIKIPDSKKTKQKLVVRRKLNLVLCGYDASGSDLAVQEYVAELKTLPLISKIFSDIKPSARQAGEVSGRSAIYYEIECVLREQG